MARRLSSASRTTRNGHTSATATRVLGERAAGPRLAIYTEAPNQTEQELQEGERGPGYTLTIPSQQTLHPRELSNALLLAARRSRDPHRLRMSCVRFGACVSERLVTQVRPARPLGLLGQVDDILVAAETDEESLVRGADPAVPEPLPTAIGGRRHIRPTLELPPSGECCGRTVRGSPSAADPRSRARVLYGRYCSTDFGRGLPPHGRVERCRRSAESQILRDFRSTARQQVGVLDYVKSPLGMT